ncbi:MAG: hypothetical protein E6Q98_14985 [Rhodospirillaceae bacterium]|nr:MAG: hypothetical protein E6Q98_14985 [Rhodospirillaceae bacterium]
MGASKRKKAAGFPEEAIVAWEARDCVDFAVALARETGWLLHVDWCAPASGSTPPKISEAEMVPLRVYVGDDRDRIFDPRGTRSIVEFSTSIIGKLARDRRPPNVQSYGVSTRTYDEAKLANMPLRFPFNEQLVSDAAAAIRGNQAFLGAIPQRAEPRLPAKIAADFSWGNCVIYAQAMEDITGLEATALCADQIHPNWSAANIGADGYVHSLIVRPDGMGEDSWGRQPIAYIAARFGVTAWHFERPLHLKIVDRLKRNSPVLWQERYDLAASFIRKFDDPR